MDFKSFDIGALKKLADPKLAGDLNAYLEAMPEKAGHSILIAAGIVWAVAAAAGMFTTIKVQQLTELRNTVSEAKALVPPVPTIRDQAISSKEVGDFVAAISKIYKNVRITARDNTVTITSNNTRAYGEFREAVGHIQNGGNGWRVSLEKLCVGRECENRTQLAATLKVNKVSIQNPVQDGG